VMTHNMSVPACRPSTTTTPTLSRWLIVYQQVRC